MKWKEAVQFAPYSHKQWRHRPVCTFMQSEQGLLSLSIYSTIPIGSVSGQQRSSLHCKNMQAILGDLLMYVIRSLFSSYITLSLGCFFVLLHKSILKALSKVVADDTEILFIFVLFVWENKICEVIISCELSASRQFTWTVKPYFLWKYTQKIMFSIAVVIST